MPRRIAPFTALIAAALLIGGVAYAVTPDTTADTASDDVVTSTTISTSTTTPSITEATVVETTSTTVDTTSTTVGTTSTTVGTTSTTSAAAPTTSTVGTTAGIRNFEAPGIGTLTVSFDGSTLALVSVQPAEGWTYTTDEITARNVEIDFWKDGVRHRAKVEIEDGDLRFEHFEK